MIIGICCWQSVYAEGHTLFMAGLPAQMMGSDYVRTFDA